MTSLQGRSDVATISATKFKATCLELLDKVQLGEIDQLEITKRGRVVAVLCPPAATLADAEALFGCMKGTFGIPDDLDLTAPVFEGEINAEEGRLLE